MDVEEHGVLPRLVDFERWDEPGLDVAAVTRGGRHLLGRAGRKRNRERRQLAFLVAVDTPHQHTERASGQRFRERDHARVDVDARHNAIAGEHACVGRGVQVRAPAILDREPDASAVELRAHRREDRPSSVDVGRYRFGRRGREIEHDEVGVADRVARVRAVDGNVRAGRSQSGLRPRLGAVGEASRCAAVEPHHPEVDDSIEVRGFVGPVRDHDRVALVRPHERGSHIVATGEKDTVLVHPHRLHDEQRTRTIDDPADVVVLPAEVGDAPRRAIGIRELGTYCAWSRSPARRTRSMLHRETTRGLRSPRATRRRPATRRPLRRSAAPAAASRSPRGGSCARERAAVG